MRKAEPLYLEGLRTTRRVLGETHDRTIEDESSLARM